jgi:hypothetical protein
MAGTPKGPPIHALNTPFNEIPLNTPLSVNDVVNSYCPVCGRLTSRKCRAYFQDDAAARPWRAKVTAKGDGVRQVLRVRREATGPRAGGSSAQDEPQLQADMYSGNAGEKAAFVEQVTNSFDASRVPAQACWSCTT